MKIQPEAVKKISQTRHFGWLVCTVLLFAAYGVMFFVMFNWSDLNSAKPEMPNDVYIACIFGLLMSPIWIIGFVRASVVLPMVLFKCLGTRAQEIADEVAVEAWPRTPADYDDLLSSIDRYRMRCQKLSVTLQFTSVVYPIGLGFLCAAVFIQMAIGSRPADISEETHWFNETFSEFRCLMAATVSLFYGFYTLYTPANLTEECIKIQTGINGNRVKKESGMVKYANPDNLTRIMGVEKLRRYHHICYGNITECVNSIDMPTEVKRRTRTDCNCFWEANCKNGDGVLALTPR